jgi:hypothetical protein
MHDRARVADELTREATTHRDWHELGRLELLPDDLCPATAPLREVSKLSKARKTTKPSSTAKPVARTPNTPAARSPSSK